MQQQMKNSAAWMSLKTILACERELEKAEKNKRMGTGVYILTMHASKGLNLIPFIFPTAMKDNPHKKSMKGGGGRGKAHALCCCHDPGTPQAYHILCGRNKRRTGISPGSLLSLADKCRPIHSFQAQSIHQTHNCPDIRRMHQQPFHTHRHPQ